MKAPKLVKERRVVDSSWWNCQGEDCHIHHSTQASAARCPKRIAWGATKLDKERLVWERVTQRYPLDDLAKELGYKSRERIFDLAFKYSTREELHVRARLVQLSRLFPMRKQRIAEWVKYRLYLYLDIADDLGLFWKDKDTPHGT